MSHQCVIVDGECAQCSDSVESHVATLHTYGGADGKRLIEASCSCGWESALYSADDPIKAEWFAEDEHSTHSAGEAWLAMIRESEGH
jgi:hypothetical protein